MDFKEILNKVDQALNENSIGESVSQAIQSVNDGMNQSIDSIQKSIAKTIGADKEKSETKEEDSSNILLLEKTNKKLDS